MGVKGMLLSVGGGGVLCSRLMMGEEARGSSLVMGEEARACGGVVGCEPHGWHAG